jgi:ParB family transcriptional regulator, chromosome partitioning protein
MAKRVFRTEKLQERDQSTTSIQRPSIQHLALNRIQDRPGGDTRPLNELHVAELTASIAVLGLITPLTLDRQNRLLAGSHRRSALQQLTQQNPERFEVLFPEGVPVRIMDVDAATDTVDALQIEVEENTQRRNYTAAEIREAARKLESAGYERLRGRPLTGQKSLNRELMNVFRLSRRRITEILNQSSGKSEQGFSLSDQMQRVYRDLEKLSAQISIPATSEELQHVQQDIARLVTSLKRAIARHAETEA